MREHFEDEFDELLLRHNPNGGRPARIGSLAYMNPNLVEIGEIRESNSQRFFLGYCKHGCKIVIGQKRAEYLVSVLHKHGVKGKSLELPLKTKIALKLLGGDKMAMGIR